MIDKTDLQKVVEKVKEKGLKKLKEEEIDTSKHKISKDVLALEWGFGELELDPSPELVPAMIRYCPKPIFVVNGEDNTDKRELALALSNFGLKKGYFEDVAANFENEKFNKICSLEGVKEWISANKVFILGGAHRHLSELDKSSKLNKEFLKFSRLLKEINASCLLIAPEQPLKYEEGYPMNPRKPIDLDQRLVNPNTMAAWINVTNMRKVKNEGWRGFVIANNHRIDPVNYLFIQGFDNFRDDNPEFIVDYDSTDPCDFQLSKSKKKEKQAEENLEPLDVELYLAHEVDGKSFRELEKESDLGRSAIHQRVQKVKEARGEEDNEG